MSQERLRDGDPSFGLSQAEYAHREKTRRRAREKKRRQRALQALRVVVAPPTAPDLIVGMTRGNRTYTKNGITLPYVSILGQRAGEAR